MKTSNNSNENKSGKVLFLRVFKQFFDQIAKGAKTTEYRVMSDYWMRKLVDVSKYGDISDEQELRTAITKDQDIKWKPWTSARFFCGDRSIEKKITGIRVYSGHDWFAIKLEDSDKKDNHLKKHRNTGG